MMLRTGALEVSSEIRSVPLEEKRKKGGPKKIQHCLSQSPPVSVRATEEDIGPEVDEEPFSPTVSSKASEEDVGLVVDEEPVSEDICHQEEEAVIDLGVKTRKRKHQGLGVSKPPKKKPRLPVPITSQVPTSIGVLSKPSRKKPLPHLQLHRHLPLHLVQLAQHLQQHPLLLTSLYPEDVRKDLVHVITRLCLIITMHK